MSRLTRTKARVLSTDDELSTLLTYSLLSRSKTSTTNHHDFFKEKMLAKTWWRDFHFCDDRTCSVIARLCANRLKLTTDV
jgi:hypothetical protein